MKLIFIRHGHPDYASGHLTELGHLHAKATAERLLDCGIDALYASPLLRAQETAAHTAERLGLPVETLDFIREIGWGSTDGTPLPYENGHPWYTADALSAAGGNLFETHWEETALFCKSKLPSRVHLVTDGFDAWMASMGFERTGDRYRITAEDNGKTIAVFGHGGSFTTVFAHLMNIPFPAACRLLDLNFTSVTTVNFEGAVGSFCVPRFEVIGDARHIRNIRTENTFMA